MSGYLDWQVGDRVVCVAQKPAGVPDSAVYPVVDCVYAIRQIRDDAQWHGRGVVVLLEGVDNTHLIGISWTGKHYYVEPGFNPNGFRRVQPRKTSIAIFERFLNDADAPIREDA